MPYADIVTVGVNGMVIDRTAFGITEGRRTSLPFDGNEVRIVREVATRLSHGELVVASGELLAPVAEYVDTFVAKSDARMRLPIDYDAAMQVEGVSGLSDPS